MAQLDSVERRSGVAARYDTGPERLAALVEALRRKDGQPVAVLIDEYDKPILDALEAHETARANREYLRGLYSVVKDADADIRFSFFTGVSKFSKGSLFSGLNNLIDITLEPEFSAVCGYTDRDLDTVFGPELAGLDRDAIRDRYNGYRWLGEEVYNPLRHPPAVPSAEVRSLLVRDRHAHVPAGHVVQAPRQLREAGRHDGRQRPPVHLRRG